MAEVTGSFAGRFLAPRFWAIWLLIGGLRLLALLPHRARLCAGGALGRLVMPWLATRRHNAERNLGLCFPELPLPHRRDLLHRHFRSLGIALIESALAWWASDRALRELIVTEGFQHLHAVQASGRGALLLAAHFTTLEIGARLLAIEAPLDVVYQRHSNPLVEAALQQGRGRHVGRLIRSDRPRELLRSLRAGRAVWYAPDQTYPRTSSVVAPFFAVPAMTNTTALKLAERTGAAILPYFVERWPDGRYHVVVEPPLELPQGRDRAAGALLLNRLVETQIRRQTTQYLWIHRRFRRCRRPDPDYYGSP